MPPKVPPPSLTEAVARNRGHADPQPLFSPLQHRDEVVGILLLMGLATLLCGLMLNPWLTVVNLDSAIFNLIGQSLMDGKGYLLASEPNGQPYFTFPPLLPFTLAAIGKVFGFQQLSQHQMALKGFIHGLFILSIPLYYLWCRIRFAKWQATVLGLSLAISPLFYKYSADVLSDVPYWALSMASLFFLTLFWQRYQTWQPYRWPLVLAIAFVVLSLLMRQVGVALILSIIAFFTINRQWKLLAISASVLLLAACLWPGYEHVYRSTHPVEADTLNQAGVQEVLNESPVKLEFIKHFLVHSPVNEDNAHVVSGPVELVDQVGKRVWAYSQILIEQLFPPLKVKWFGHRQNLFDGLIVPLWALLGLGLWSLCRAYPLLGWYLLFYWSIFAVYPYISPRFMVPVLPLMMAALFQGFLNALRMGVAMYKHRLPKATLKRAYAGVIITVLLVILGAGQLPQTVRWVKAGFRLKVANAGPSLKHSNASYYQALQWAKTHTPPNALLLTRKPPVATYYANRKAIAFPFTSDTGQVLRYILERNAHHTQGFSGLYIVEDTAFGETERYLSPALTQFSDYFEPVYTTPGPEPTTLYRLKMVRG